MDIFPLSPKKDWRQAWEHISVPLLKGTYILLSRSESVLQWLAHTFHKARAEDIQGLLLSLQCMEQLSICSPHKSLHCAKILGVFKYAVRKTQSKLNTSLLNCWYMWVHVTYLFMPQHTTLVFFQQHNIVTINFYVADVVSEVQLLLWRVISSPEQIVCHLLPMIFPCVSCYCYTSNSKLSRQHQVLAVRRDLLKEWGHFVISLGLLGHMKSLPAIPATP